ncbi:hypothetical protein ACWD4O_13415 [Streptomyces sp. NPDC002623]
MPHPVTYLRHSAATSDTPDRTPSWAPAAPTIALPALRHRHAD